MPRDVDSLAHNQVIRRTRQNTEISRARSRWLARTWRIESQDPTVGVIRLTDWNAPILIGGDWYTPSKNTNRGRVPLSHERGGQEMGAQRREGGFREQSAEIRGVVDSDLITAQDIDEGVWDGALIYTSSVDPRYPWVELPGGSLYRIESLTRTSEGRYQADMVQEVNRKLGRRQGTVLARNCNANLFDGQCNSPHVSGGEAPLDRAEWLVENCTIQSAVNEFQYDIALPSFSNAVIDDTPTDDIVAITPGNPTTFTTASALPYSIGETFETQVFGFFGISPEIRGRTWTATVTGSNEFTLAQGVTTSGTATSLPGQYYVNLRTRVTFVSSHGWGGLVGRFLNVPLTMSGVSGNTNLNRSYSAGQVFVSGGNSLEVPVITPTGLVSTGGFTFVDPVNGWFNNGELEVTDVTSRRVGQKFTISQLNINTTAENPVVRFVIEHPTRGRVEESSEVSLLVGCQKRLIDDCATKFANRPNFRGLGIYSVSSTQAIQTPKAT